MSSRSDPALVAAALEAAGLAGASVREQARRLGWYVTAHERTVRRWATGEQTVPAVARDWLRAFAALPAPERRQLVALLDLMYAAAASR